MNQKSAALYTTVCYWQSLQKWTMSFVGFFLYAVFGIFPTTNIFYCPSISCLIINTIDTWCLWVEWLKLTDLSISCTDTIKDKVKNKDKGG